MIIEKVGPETIMVVMLDGGGDWQATKDMIQNFYPWISFKHCTSHGTSLIVKDCFKEDGGITELVELNATLTDAQLWFSTHACSSFIKSQSQPGEKSAFVWPAVTRYCGVLLKIKRFYDMKALLRRVVSSGVYLEKNFVDDPFPAIINGAEIWQKMERVIKTMGPLLLLCRLADGQKPVMSKLHGTQLHVRKLMEDVATAGGDGSLENKIYLKFLGRWPSMQSEISMATYMLEPLFVDNSRQSAPCTIALWSVARKIFRVDSDAEWTTLHGILVEQLSKFQSKGASLAHMSSPAAWKDLHSKCALQWWIQWGVEVPQLQKLAIKIVPLLVGSGPAERTWKDVGQIMTKNRNRLTTTTCKDLVFARTWLRRELNLVSDEELEVFNDWEAELLDEAAAAPIASGQPEMRIFVDQFETWEQNAIDGKGEGPIILLGDVKKNKQMIFRLQEKYKDMFFVDKDPDGDTDYYTVGGGEPLSEDKWEHRKIMGLIWENKNGWRLETKICTDLEGTSSNYLINSIMIRMIKESTHNRGVVRFRSDM